jgi:hypothetical protein
MVYLCANSFRYIRPNQDTARDVVNPSRHIELDIDIGADAKDWSAIAAGEKLKPTEIELRRIEEQVAEIVAEMDYLRSREQKLRDTNESTNTRVKWFAFGTMFLLIGLGVWQVIYLRTYFRYAPILPLWDLSLIHNQIQASHLDTIPSPSCILMRPYFASGAWVAALEHCGSGGQKAVRLSGCGAYNV